MSNSNNGFKSVRPSYEGYEEWVRDHSTPFTGWELAALRKDMDISRRRLGEILGVSQAWIMLAEQRSTPLHKSMHPERMHRLRRLVNLALADTKDRLRKPDFND